MLDEEGAPARRPPRSSPSCSHALGRRVARRAAGRRRRLLGRVHRRRARPRGGDDERGRHRRAGAREGPRAGSASGSTSGWPAARTCPSTTTRSTSSCSTTSTSTSSTPRRSSPTSTACCGPGGCSTSASATGGRSSSRTTGCRSCRGCRDGAADRYLRLTGKGDHYYERYYTPAGLRRLFAAFDVWDYTLPGAHRPAAFSADDNVPAWAAKVPPAVFRRRAAARARPTCGRRSRVRPTPAGPPLPVPPRHLAPMTGPLRP